MYEALEITRDGAVATIWMNRPQRHNAFDAALIAELTQAFTQLGADDETRIVILAGRGKNFSAGGDLNWMKAAGEAGFDANLADAEKLAQMFRILAEMPKPTIARVHGAALGGGMGLASACDICVASTEASFATSEVRLGIIPAVISPYVLRAIGVRQASRCFLTAERIDAAKALQIGLVHEVTEAEALDAGIDDLISALLKGGPQAQAAAKRLIRNVAGKMMGDALAQETAHNIAALRMNAEAREGLSAFLDKRAPAWINRTGSDDV